MTQAAPTPQVVPETPPATPEEQESAALFAEFAAKHAAPAADEAAGDDAGAEPGEGDGPAGENQPEPSPAEGAAPAAPVQPETPAAGTPAATPDPNAIWAGATPEAKAAHDAALARVSALENTDAENRNRMAGMNRKITDLSQTIAASTTTPAAGKAEGAAEVTELAKLLDDPDFVAAEKEYPEVYKPIRKTMGNLIAQFENRIKAEIEPIRATTTTAAARFADEDMKSQGAELARLAPTYLATVQMPEFHGAFGPWLASKPEEIQTMARNATAIENGQSFVRDASKTATLFKMFTDETGFGKGPAPAPAPAPRGGSPQPRPSVRRQLQLEAVSDVPDGSPGAPSPDTDGSSSADWNRFASKAAARNRDAGFV